MSKLTEMEFAINKNSNLQIDRTNVKLVFTKDENDIITMHLSMPFIPDINKIQIGPGDLKFYSSGVHAFDAPNYNAGLFNDVSIRILDDEEQIILQSKSADFTLVTKGDKREHGSAALLSRLLSKLAIENELLKKH